jgi:para-nitrobenzyl esterase
MGSVYSAWGLENALQVTGGVISGTTENGAQAFKGIPFAAPPVEVLRWKPPQPVSPWDDVKTCAEFAPACPQTIASPDSFYAFTNPAKIDEDCLYLNVWTAADSADEKRPVMVWFHGGGLTRCSGADARFNGANLAKKGVILVTVNYRLGAFGFLAHPELTQEEPKGVSGNYGVLDQIAALHWVRQNIAQFGGDPENVTIFGQSAGSWSVQVLVSTPLAKGLFHRAIGQSGGLFNEGTWLDRVEEGNRSGHQIGEDFLAACGVETIAEARALPASKLVEASVGKGSSFQTRPVVDGWILPDTLDTIFANGLQNDVPMIVGSTANEWTSLSSPAYLPQTTSELEEQIGNIFPDAVFADFVAAFGGGSDDTAMDAYLATIRDIAFSTQMRQWARATENVSSNAYVYWFTAAPPIENSEYLGAYHSAEVPYAFQNISPDFGNEDRALSDAMSDYWVNFAKTGNPNSADLPKWESYNLKTEPYLNLGHTIRAGNHLLKRELDYLDKLRNAE